MVIWFPVTGIVPWPTILSPTAMTWPDSDRLTPSAISIPSTNSWPNFTVGLTPSGNWIVIWSLSRTTKQRRTISDPDRIPWIIPSSLHMISVRVTTAPFSISSPSLTINRVRVLPWVASAIASRRITKDSKITNCNFLTSGSFSSGSNSISAANCGASMPILITNWVRSSSTPSTERTRSPSL